MKGFSDFLEALKFNDPNANRLQSHPLVNNATVGVEIELIAAAAPFNDMKPEWLAMALNGSEFEKEFMDAQGDDYEKDDGDFVNYIVMHKKQAWDAMWELIETMGFNADKTDDHYKQAMVDYWGKKLADIVKSAGFKIQRGKEASNDVWAYGDDGQDSEYNLPVLEVRSSVLSQKDMEALSRVFVGVSALSKANPKELMARGNTGLHVHVGNPNTGQKNGYVDAFSRLASATTADENEIWDTSSNHDRSFERHAALNRPQDFESNGKHGAHEAIMTMLDRIMSKNSKTTPAPATNNFNGMFNSFRPGEHPGQQPGNTMMVSNRELGEYVMSLSRNAGINVTSEHPTVEYRYLSSQVLVENPAKALQFVKYFIYHTASMSNKGRIKFENDEVRYVLTKMPKDMVRIDRQVKKDHEQEWEDEIGRSLPSTYKYPRIPKPNTPRTELDKPGDGRNDQPFMQWFKSLPPIEQEKLRNKKV